MSGKLSERFAQIKKTVVADRPDQNRKLRVQQTKERQTNQRANQVNAKRGINKPAQQQQQAQPRKNKNAPAPAGGPGKKLQRRPNSAKGGKVKVPGNANNKKAAKKAAPKREKEAPVSSTDLDKQMAAYWHKAGKGPDPEKMELDQQLEAYRAATAAAAPASAESS